MVERENNDTVRDARSRFALAIFAHAPILGRVKTPLVQKIGPEAACALYEAMLRDCLAIEARGHRQNRRYGVGGRESNYDVWLCYTPDDALQNESMAALEITLLLPQRGAQLGTRMVNCFTDLWTRGYERVIIIGSDVPDLPPSIITIAFWQVLEGWPLVFGPARDGGFYLIGAGAPFPSDLFDEVTWSAPDTLAQVMARAQQKGLRVGRTQEWEDVNTPDDFERLCQKLKNRPDSAPHTWHWLRSQNLL